MSSPEPDYGLQHLRRYCYYCRRYKALSEFYAKQSTRDRLANKCKACWNVDKALRQAKEKMNAA